MGDTGGHIVSHGWKVHVRNPLAKTVLADDGCNGVVVRMLDSWEQVMFDLVV